MNLKKLSLEAVEEAIKEVLPENCIKRNIFLLKEHILRINQKTVDLKKFSQINLIAFGKASIQMSASLMDLIPISKGIIVSNEDLNIKFSKLNKFIFIKAGHPVPNENSFLAGKEILNFAKNTKEEHLTFLLISGGGSSLVEYSKFSLKEFQILTEKLLRSGANINEINIVRKKISLIKGGKLLRNIKGKVIALIMSDVVGDRLDTIASGPTFYDKFTIEHAIEILKKYNIESDIIEKIKNGILEKPLSKQEYLKKDVQNLIIGSNRDACKKIVNFFKKKKFQVLYLGSQIQGEAREVAKVIGGIASEISNGNIGITKPAVIISGGETTVKVKGNGTGGRNQELALAMFPYIENIKGVFLSFGTDGIDGPTDAAGAIIDSEVLDKAKKLNLNWETYLKENNSYNFFQKTDGLIKTGSTGTNVADIQIFIIL